jgi:hypothetical protein
VTGEYTEIGLHGRQPLQRLLNRGPVAADVGVKYDFCDWFLFRVHVLFPPWYDSDFIIKDSADFVKRKFPIKTLDKRNMPCYNSRKSFLKGFMTMSTMHSVVNNGVKRVSVREQTGLTQLLSFGG